MRHVTVYYAGTARPHDNQRESRVNNRTLGPIFHCAVPPWEYLACK